MSTGRPVVVIGLDGATWRLLDRWIGAGDPPERIKSEGNWAPLESCIPPGHVNELEVLLDQREPVELRRLLVGDCRRPSLGNHGAGFAAVSAA